jgi:hypothetical protein
MLIASAVAQSILVPVVALFIRDFIKVFNK